MNEQADHSKHEVDGWPLPSPDVRRELAGPDLVWVEPESTSSWPTRPTARG